MKETELAQKIIDHFEQKGYLSYKEVSMSGRGGDPRADIYFIKKEGDKIVDSIVVETKTNLSTKVIEQADVWKNGKLANKVYICVPFVSKNMKSRRFLLKICRILGIGVFQYYTKRYGLISPGINETIPSTIEDNIKKYPPLFEEQRSSIAGNDRSEYVTKFKLTVTKLNELMKNKENYIWNDLIKELDHHYHNDKSASSALKKLINQKAIVGYRFDKIDKKICLIKDDFNI